MTQSPSYVSPTGAHLVCRLRKALHGFKQSPHAWFDKFSVVVLQYGFLQSTFDHSVFVRRSSAGTIILIVYVDDIVISGDDSVGIVNLMHYLSGTFHTKDLGLLRYFLGIEVARSSVGLFLTQRMFLIFSLRLVF